VYQLCKLVLLRSMCRIFLDLEFLSRPFPVNPPNGCQFEVVSE
jgi:hypothetical protein